MELKTILFITNALVAFIIAYLTGHQKRAILIPSSLVGVGLSILMLNPNGFGIFGFLMFFVLVTGIYGFGAFAASFIGIRLREKANASAKQGNRLWVNVGIAVILLGIIATSILFSINEKRWKDITETSAKLFVQQQQEILLKTGIIHSVDINTTGHDAAGNRHVTYFVKGDQATGLVSVAFTGTADEPIFSIESIEVHSNTAFKRDALKGAP